MKIEKLSRKEFKKRFPKEGAGVERYKGEEPTVYLPERASTKEILHEIYHATLSPDLEKIEQGQIWYSPDEQVLEELRAQEFARGKIGKDDMTLESMWSAIYPLLEVGDNPAVVMGSLTRGLKTLGYEPLNGEERHYLWEMMRNYKRVTEEV